jgi:hypothetical protein
VAPERAREIGLKSGPGPLSKIFGIGGITRVPEILKGIDVVYVSGPMRGRPDFNHPTFNEVADVLRDRGLGNEDDDHPRVTNPAENFGGRTDLPIAPAPLASAAKSCT